jgi:cyclic pyranopterin phosphate synthase
MLDRVLAGIRSVEECGFDPIKLNMVVMRGINDDEILDFARLTLEKPYHIRFIEFMPIGAENGWSEDRFVSIEDMRNRIQEELGELIPVTHEALDGPAERFRLEGAKGEVGFIGALTHHFCDVCNRLRLTSEGNLRGCLFSDQEIDIKTPLRNGAGDQEILEVVRRAVAEKPRGHGFHRHGPHKCTRAMSSIGG